MTATIIIRGHLKGDPERSAQTALGNTYTHAKVRGDHDGHGFDWPLITGDEAVFAPFRAGDHVEVSGRLKARRMGEDWREGSTLPFLNDPRCYFLVFVEQVTRAGPAGGAFSGAVTLGDAAQPASAIRPKATSPRRRRTVPLSPEISQPQPDL